MSVETNLASVRQRIAQACTRSGRAPSVITLVCVTKGVQIEAIRQALAAGVGDLGENRVQEARAKQEGLGVTPQAVRPKLHTETGIRQPGACSVQPVQWHMLGHLQRNKAGLAVDLFDVIHSIDSVAVIEEVERQAGTRAKTVEVFLQVNVASDAAKHGCRPEDVPTLATAIQRATHLRLAGLMMMAPFTDNPEAARPHFQCVRQLRDDLRVAGTLGPGACRLSMGMTQDFEVAIEEGADLVRIGTAIFGARDR